MKRRTLFTVVLVAALAAITWAQEDMDAFKQALAVANPTAKAKALEEFVVKYPASAQQGTAYRTLFELYLAEPNESGALRAADGFLHTLKSSDLVSWYNNFSYELAEKGIGLDTALAYIERCDQMIRASGASMPAMYKDTYAYVLYKNGDAAKAVELQKEAVKGHETDAEYVGHLAQFEEASGQRRAAIGDMAKALYLGSDPSSKTSLLDWIGKEEPTERASKALKDSIVWATIHAFTDTLKGVKLQSGRSKAAAYLADLGVDLKTAETWARASVKALTDNSPDEEVVARNKNLAVIEATVGRNNDALRRLQSVRNLVALWDTKFWQTLGDLYLKFGKTKEAKEAYLQGSLAVQDPHMRQSLEDVYKSLGRPADSINADMAAMKAKLANPEPGRAPKKVHPSGRVVLAELFTGAECGPCAGADAAFDELSEYYRRSDVAIIEYHVHIPGPDPMTTDANAARFQHYAGQGTPTAIFDGTDQMVGGGPKYMAENRFNVYRHGIEKESAKSPRTSLRLNVTLNKGVADVKASVGSLSGLGQSAKPALHIALVERSVEYHGSNGVTKHLFVVRELVGGSDGISLKPGAKTQTVTRAISLADVEQSIKTSVDNPTSQKAWPKYLRNFAGWKDTPKPLDESNLAVVAWVQDGTSNQVFQAAYQDVPAGNHPRTATE